MKRVIMPIVRVLQVAAIAGAVQLSSACAVYMAASGDERTVSTVAQDGTVVKTKTGAEPSAGRAIGHGVMDVLTFGLWEAIGTPIELAVRASERDDPVSE